VYLAVAAVASGLYVFGPVLQGNGPLFNVISGSSVIAIFVGIHIYRPEAAWAWRWFGIGQGLFFLGDAYTYSYPVFIGRDVPFPSIGDAFYIAVYPALMIGVLLGARRRNPQGDRAGVIDALIIAVGFALLSWVFLIAPYVHDATLSPFAKVVSIDYPVGDVILLAAALRLAFDGGRRNGSFYLLAASIATLLATDAAYGYALLDGSYDHQVSYDAGWLVFYLLWGAAALHPSMRAFFEATPDRERRLSWQRLGLLTVAVLIAPAIELVGEARRGDYDLVLIVATSIVVFLLVVLRVLGLVRQNERTVVRERALRHANLALVKATTLDEIGAVALATAQLLVKGAGEARLCLQRPAGLVLVTAAAEVSLPQSTVWLLEEAAATPDERVALPAGAHGDLDLAADIGHANVFPLAALHDRRAVLVAAAPAPLSPILVEALDALRASVSLALASAVLSEQVHRQDTEEQLAHQAFHDAVTGLPNRALFSDRVEHALAFAAREGTNVAVIFLDLDDFKTTNYSLGHAAGDEVLRQVATRLLAAARPADTTARFGGDTFAILLEDVGDPVAAIDFAEQLVRGFELPIPVTGKRLLVRSSIGIAISSADEGATRGDADELIRSADAAMHICKGDGKGGYRVFETAMHERVLERLELRAALQRAIDAGQFELHYQPVVDLQHGEVTGMEALVRWHHPTRGFVQPGQFIALAEEMGLIVDLGRWVLREACLQIVRLHAAGDVAADFVISVNLSVKQLQHPDVIADVRAVLEDSGIAPGTLVLEITETVMMADYELASMRLQQLKDLGVRIAMDDFGTGYSSLGYLSRLPVDILKMDRSFLSSNAPPEATGLAAAIIALGRNLGVRVVAEGIESAEQYEALRELGCDYGQGFFIARPMDLAATRGWLASAEQAWRSEAGRKAA
jgi:diguanylate cyclase (GGDEF)-like protein